MPSLKEENEALCQLMEQRAQDHKRWVQELADSVVQSRRFKLATDPHQCAFGKWYDTYKTDNLLMSSFLKEFDEPHKKIHGMAMTVTEMVGSVRDFV